MFNFKLRNKITAFMILLMAMVILVNTGILAWDFTKRYTAALQLEAAVIAKNLRNEIIKLNSLGVAFDSIEGLSGKCLDIVKHYPNIGYASVTNDKGVILYHSSKEEVGKKRDSRWIEALERAAEDDKRVEKSLFKNEKYFDITIPVKEGKKALGYISVGMSEKVIIDALKHPLGLGFMVVSLSLAFVVLVSFIFGQRVVAPLNRLNEMFKDIAMGGGDLTRRLNIDSKDEIGDIACSFDRFVENIQAMIGKFKETTAQMYETAMKISVSTGTVSEGADAQQGAAEKSSSSIENMKNSFVEIAANIENLSSETEEASSSILEMAASIVEVAGIAEDVSSAVDESSSSIEEMTISTREVASIAEELSISADSTVASIGQINASINEVERSTKDSASVAQETAADAEKGMLAVEKTIEGMNKIKTSVEDAASVIKKLVDKSGDIGEILDVIDEIAEQTNLLALNAAIIAAQAGEHGKSFAVVADEIKDLSERTAASTKEIASLIKAVQNESNNAVKSMEFGSQSVSEGVELSQEAGESLEKILLSAMKSKDMINHITKATTEQLKGSQQVKEAMENVNHLIMRIATATQEQSKGSELIIEATESMKDATDHVKRATQEQSKGGKQITEAIENITNMTNFVNGAIQEQADKVRLMVGSTDEIKDLSLQYRAVVNDMNAAVDSLVSHTEILSKEIEDFKV